MSMLLIAALLCYTVADVEHLPRVLLSSRLARCTVAMWCLLLSLIGPSDPPSDPFAFRYVYGAEFPQYFNGCVYFVDRGFVFSVEVPIKLMAAIREHYRGGYAVRCFVCLCVVVLTRRYEVAYT